MLFRFMSFTLDFTTGSILAIFPLAHFYMCGVKLYCSRGIVHNFPDSHDSNWLSCVQNCTAEKNQGHFLSASLIFPQNKIRLQCLMYGSARGVEDGRAYNEYSAEHELVLLSCPRMYST